jgi:hypothetical protein
VINKILTLPIDASDTTDSHKAILSFNNANAPIFKSTWMRFPPVKTNNVFNALAVFVLPKKVLSTGI